MNPGAHRRSGRNGALAILVAVAGAGAWGGCREAAAPANGRGAAAEPAAASAGGPNATAAALPDTHSASGHAARLAPRKRSEHFAPIVSNLDLGGETFVFADIDGDLGRFSDLVTRLNREYSSTVGGNGLPPDLIARVFSATGMKGLAAWGASSLREGGLVRNRIALLTPSGRTGLFAVTGGDPISLRLLDIAPAGCAFAGEFDLDLEPWYRARERLAKAAGAGLVAELAQRLKRPLLPVAAAPTWGDLRHLKTRLTVVVSFREGESLKLPGGTRFPSFDVVGQSDGLSGLLDALLPALRAMPDAFTVTGGATELTVSAKSPITTATGWSIQPVVIRKGSGRSTVTWATTAEALQSFLSPENRLRGDPEFQAVSQGLPGEGNGLIYFAPAAFDALRMLATNLEVMQPAINASTDRVLASFLGSEVSPGGAVATWSNRPDGITGVLQAPVSWKAAGGVHLGLAGAAVVSNGVYAVLGRPMSEKARIKANLRLIAQAADTFFIKQGITPAPLDGVVGEGKHLPALPASVAGEDYSKLFPIDAGYRKLEVITADGRVVVYSEF